MSLLNGASGHGACWVTLVDGVTIQAAASRRRRRMSDLDLALYNMKLRRRRLQTGSNATAPAITEDFSEMVVTEFVATSLAFPPPLLPSPPSPPSPPGPPPSPPAPPPFCVPGVDDFSEGSFCHATIAVTDCKAPKFISQRCIVINRPFVAAFLAGRCVDQAHWRQADIDCLEIQSDTFFVTGLGNLTRIYMTARGFAISGNVRDVNGWGRPNAPAIRDDIDEVALPIRVGARRSHSNLKPTNSFATH
jgi:hypothetical protein